MRGELEKLTEEIQKYDYSILESNWLVCSTSSIGATIASMALGVNIARGAIVWAIIDTILLISHLWLLIGSYKKIPEAIKDFHQRELRAKRDLDRVFEILEK